MAGTRSYAAGSFFFNLQGVKCGFLKAVAGGDISAEVVEEKTGPDYFTKKHIGQPKYEDIELTIGFDMVQDVYEWIAASWKQNYSRKDGSVVVTDQSLQAKSERQFFHALITEVGIPALDAAAKDAAYLTVKFSPEYTREVKAAGKLVMPKPSVQKRFLPSNFRLEIDGLDCTKVSRIDAFTVKQSVAADDVGDGRDVTNEPGRLDFPNLRVTLAEAGDATWVAWFDDFVIKGDNEDSKEKSGRIVFLGPDRKQELGRIELHNLGIFALRHPAPAAADAVSRVVAELYCERMEFQVGKPAPAPPTPPAPTPIQRKPIPLPR
ncbi:MAG TPA: phage tail protein [Gaiellaceae bacterium]|nr:phage tail protein [Gaiellaceae bacterium]